MPVWIWTMCDSVRGLGGEEGGQALVIEAARSPWRRRLAAQCAHSVGSRARAWRHKV
eukprot:COSAG02_NODE_47840_length_338_cov_0.799163_1_plen_56_part_10